MTANFDEHSKIAMETLTETSKAAAKHVERSIEWQKQAIKQHLGFDFSAMMDSFWVQVYIHILNPDGSIKRDVLVVGLILACLLLDVSFSIFFPGKNNSANPEVVNTYKKAAQKNFENAVAEKTSSENNLEESKAELKRVNEESNVKDEERLNRAYDQALIATDEDVKAQLQLEAATDRLVQVNMVEARWPDFARHQWKLAQEYSLQSDDASMDKVDLKNFLQSPENKWRFAGKQYTEANLDELFEKMDTNHDGVIDQGEFMEFFLGPINQ